MRKLAFVLITSCLSGNAISQPPASTIKRVAIPQASLQAITRDARSVQLVGPNNVARSVSAVSRLSLTGNEFLAVRTNQTTQIESKQNGVTIGRLPIRLLVRSASGALESLDMKFQTAGLSWQPKSRQFTGQLLLGVVKSDAPNESGSLSTKVQMQIVAPNGGTATPSVFSIQRKGIPFKAIEIATNNPPQPFNVRVLASFDSKGAEVPMSVRRPVLQLSVTPRSINGLGAESAQLTVTSSEGPSAANTTVILSTSRGDIENNRLFLDQTGTATSSIRSAGIGTATITATAESFLSTNVKLPFLFPTSLLIAIALGTILGSTLWTYLVNIGKPRGALKLAVDWFVGIVAGVGLTFAVFGQINLANYLPLPKTMGSEAAATGVAFFAALLGVTISKIMLKAKRG